MYIVLTTHGKNESVDFARVTLFNSLIDAQGFIDQNNTGKCKHWTKAELVFAGETTELSPPEE